MHEDAGVGGELVGVRQLRLRLGVDRLRLHEHHVVRRVLLLGAAVLVHLHDFGLLSLGLLVGGVLRVAPVHLRVGGDRVTLVLFLCGGGGGGGVVLSLLFFCLLFIRACLFFFLLALSRLCLLLLLLLLDRLLQLAQQLRLQSF